jgi:hypothetical protein
MIYVMSFKVTRKDFFIVLCESFLMLSDFGDKMVWNWVILGAFLWVKVFIR